MNKLFIIGNGFDCYCHNMKTQYEDFRNYIFNRFPNIIISDEVPIKKLTSDHHGYDYDENEIAGYIVHIIDSCEGEKWSNLEYALGDMIYSVMDDAFNDVDMEDDDNDIYTNIECNEATGNYIAETVTKLKGYFFDWVNNDLNSISYKKITRKRRFRRVLKGMDVIEKIMRNNRFYINFNYTYSLEKIYGIPSSKVYHIHGKVGDSFNNIYFGHGNNDLKYEVGENWGADDSLNEVINYFRKDTAKVIRDNRKIFEEMRNVTQIYSVGFSFSDVDMVYIDEICKYIVPTQVAWYFNKYDMHNNKEYVRKIKERGFVVKSEMRW